MLINKGLNDIFIDLNFQYINLEWFIWSNGIKSLSN